MDMSQSNCFSEEQKEEIERILQLTLGKYFEIPMEEYFTNNPSFFLNYNLNYIKLLINQNERAIRYNYKYLEKNMATKKIFKKLKKVLKNSKI